MTFYFKNKSSFFTILTVVTVVGISVVFGSLFQSCYFYNLFVLYFFILFFHLIYYIFIFKYKENIFSTTLINFLLKFFKRIIICFCFVLIFEILFFILKPIIITLKLCFFIN